MSEQINMARESQPAGATHSLADVSPFIRDVDDYIRAGYQCLSINTTELRRVEDELLAMVTNDPMDYDAVLTWDINEGFRVKAINRAICTPKQAALLNTRLEVSVQLAPGETGPSKIGTSDPLVALRYSVTKAHEFPFQNCIIIYRNLHIPLATEFKVAQFWQTAVSEKLFNLEMPDPNDKTKQKTIIRRRLPLIVGTASKFSPAVRPTVTNVEFQLPGIEHMRKIFNDLDRSARVQSPGLPSRDDPAVVAVTDAAIQLLLGLSATEASDAVALCAVKHENLCYPEILDTIEHQKAETLENATALKYIKRRDIGSEDDVAGFSAFKPWIRMRRHCYSQAGMTRKLDRPKGTVLFGVPGTAKSIVGAITARTLNLPLIEMDVGQIFGSLVGESEQRMADSIRTIEAMRGCVVRIDEADKLWGGANTSSGDSGVTRRVFGKFLSWMANKTDGSFIIMTANRTDGMPPEFLRKGRFDEVWYTDLPSVKEREQILRIHLRRRGLDIDTLFSEADLDEFLSATEGYVGAEIEESVKEARLIAFADNGRDPKIDDFREVLARIIPLIKLDEAGIKAIRDFCSGKARPVEPVLQDEEQKPITGNRAVQTRRGKATS